jgi:PPP family 3-phenylpropionic acid transporter
MMPCKDDLAGQRHGNAFAVRLGAFYVAVFLVGGCYLTLLPLWLKWRGFTPEQISLLFAAPAILRPFFVPVVMSFADYYAKPAAFLKALGIISLCICVFFPGIDSFAVFFSIFLAYALCWVTIIPLTEALAILGVKAGHCDYGRVRLWGSASFIAMAVGGGMVVDALGAGSVIWLYLGAIAGVALVSLLLREPNDGACAAKETAPSQTKTMRLADIGQLLRSSEFWFLLIASGAIQSAHAVYYVFGSIHWKAIGISPTLIGLLWAVGVVAEIVLFIYAGRLSLRFGAVQFILIGGAAAMLRWLCTAFDPPLATLFALQCLHGLTFGATHFGAMQFLRHAVPQRVSLTAQGIYAAFSGGIAMGLMQLAAGPLYSKLHGHAYLVMVALGAIGVGAALFLMRRWKDGAPLFGQEAE